MPEILLTARDREVVASHLATDPPACPAGLRPGSWRRLLAGDLDYIDFGEWVAIWAVLPAVVRWLLITAEPTAPNFGEKMTRHANGGRRSAWALAPALMWNPDDWTAPNGESDPPIIETRPRCRRRRVVIDTWTTIGREIRPPDEGGG